MRGPTPRTPTVHVARIACAVALLAALAHAEPAPQYFPPIQHPPLDLPLQLTGTFGEYRGGHFHAGLDFSTGEEVGKPVYASLRGRIVRVRASGAGYGRSIYLEADDGRLLVYGHLDAFAEPFASFVAARQESAGIYEQDLWIENPVFRVTPGQRLGWSGRSGTGPPHLHFEIRRGDIAYNPLLAGVTVEDKIAPKIGRVSLEPLDSQSWGSGEGVAGEATPDSDRKFNVAGRVRVIAEAVDARANGRWTMAPWSTVLEIGGTRVECRFDSVSWAEGMTEVDYVYDRGRTVPEGQYAMVLGAPAGFRPRVIRTNVPDSTAAGTLDLRKTQGDLRARIETRDVAGNSSATNVRLRVARARDGADGWHPFPADSIAPIDFDGIPDQPSAGRRANFEWVFPGNAWFERSRVRSDTGGVDTTRSSLRRVSGLYAFWPALLPLRVPFRATIDLPRGVPSGRVALYRNSGAGWEWVGAEFDTLTRHLGGSTRRLGRFALFEDLTAPRITLIEPPKRAPRAPYPRWALEAALEEDGSGVDRRASYLVVDGRRVPTEWDEERRVLRWTPLASRKRGRRNVEVVAVDRAGNVARQRGRFVLN